MKRWMVTAALVTVMTFATAMTAFGAGWMLDGEKWWYATDDAGNADDGDSADNTDSAVGAGDANNVDGANSANGANNGDNAGESWYVDGWEWLDGNHDGQAERYYFGSDGYLVVDGMTPDGYKVNADGAWVENGEVQRRSSLGPGARLPEGSATIVRSADGYARGGQQTQGRYVDPTLPMVALTFDDGPNTGAGNRIMDTLAAYGGKSTFFVVGDRCASRASELQRMVAEGHEVANHTYQHKYLQKLDAAQIQYQIDQGSAAITAACGVVPTLVRLPGGNKNDTVIANVNYPMIQWSLDTVDWQHRNAQKSIEAVLNHVKDGDIILMHELYDATATAVETIVPELVARGYQLVTVSEMAAARGVQLQPHQLYSSFRPQQ